MTYNFVYHKTYWNEAAKTNPFARICHGYTQEKFWESQPSIPGLGKDMIFLDFGCGIGRIASSVAPLVKEYYGVDFSEEMVEKAKVYHKNCNNIRFFVNNGYDLSIFEEGVFDFVYSCLVFIHIHREQIIPYVDEIYRILKPGGVFYTRNFPRKEKYDNGFFSKEAQEVFSNFKEVDIRDFGEWYYSIRCRK